MAMFRNNGLAIFFAQGSSALCCTLLYGLPNVPSQDQGAADCSHGSTPGGLRRWIRFFLVKPTGNDGGVSKSWWNHTSLRSSPVATIFLEEKQAFFSQVLLAIWPSDSNLMLSGISSSFRMAFLKANLQWESHGLPPQNPKKIRLNGIGSLGIGETPLLIPMIQLQANVSPFFPNPMNPIDS